MDLSSEAGWTVDELIGGHLALDFVNTMGGATKRREIEHLADYNAVLRWCLVSETLSEAEIDTLERSAEAAADTADDVLRQLHAFREALHSCLMAEQAGAHWPDDQKAHVQPVILLALSRANLERVDQRYRWCCQLGATKLELPLMRLALAAEELLRSADLVRMRNCDRCSWLFIDRGRGRARRWCSMAACGSRAKSARYYYRRKGER